MKRFILITLALSLNISAITFVEVKKLQYSEQTTQNLKRYKDGLEELVSQNNIEAILMIANSYDTGSHWDKDILQAKQYYIKAAKLGSGKAFMKLAMYDYNAENFTRAKTNFKNAIKGGQTKAIKYLLDIAIIEKNKEDLDRYIKFAKQNNIIIDEFIINKISTNKNKKSKFMKYIDDKTFNTSKDYVIGILKIVSSLDGAFKNLGYSVNEYVIHNSLEPTIELILNKVQNTPIDEEMAMLIAGDNILKRSILKSLIWANNIEPYINKESNHKLLRVELEVGTSAVAKIVTREIKND